MASPKRSPKSLQLAELREFLQRAGSHEATDKLARQIYEEQNAIRNDDGTFNVVHIVAWMAKDVT